jgi:ATP-dependent DNA helicase RecG
MNQQELLQVIAEGESETVEFKESFGKSTVNAAGAFANTKGGMIIVGVSDKGAIRGVNVGDETLNNWVNQITQSTDPRIIPTVELNEVENETVVVIRVLESLMKPIAVNGRFYQRVGKSTRVLTSQDIFRMHLSSTRSSWDASPSMSNASLNELDEKTMRRFVDRAVHKGRLPYEYSEEFYREAVRSNFNYATAMHSVIERFHLAADERLTNGSILLFGTNPQTYFPDFSVRVLRLKAEADIIDDKRIEGNLFQQCEGALAAIRQNIGKAAKIDGVEREDFPDYPLAVVREALLNALTHRDYVASHEFIQIKIYDDYIWFFNPGGLPEDITIEDLKRQHKAHPRNPRIADVFYHAGYVEESGTGTLRMVRRMKEAGLPEPEFKEEYGGFSVYLYKNIYTEEKLRELGLNERQTKAVMWAAKEGGSISNSEYRNITGLSHDGAFRDLRDLVEKNVLKTMGKGRSVRYMLRKSDD